MPRTLSPELKDCLERANPYTEYRIEIAEPDVGQVLRRQDQFTQAPSLVSQTPASSLAASARGSLILTPSVAALVSFAGTTGSYDLNVENEALRYKGLSWTIDPAFSRATLRSIQAKIQATPVVGFYFDQAFELQIFQITRTPGVKQLNVGASNYQQIAFTEYTFTPLLSPAPVVKVTRAQWLVSAIQTLNFDLSVFAMIAENAPTKAITPDQVGLLPKLLIAVRLVGTGLGGTGHYQWLTDNASSRTVANIGTFERVFWGRTNENSQWSGDPPFPDVPNCTINIETYPVTGQGIYLIDQGTVPKAQSTGRLEFQRALPPETTATAEISTAGSGGPWTAIKHGDVVTPAQQQYWLRTTLNSDATHHATPEVIAQGIEFRIPQDVSIEAIPTFPTREIALPWPKASIPEGRLRVVRTGLRDYQDIGSVIGSTSASSRLEADIFLASRHPSVTRDKWFRLERMMVANRLPSATSEEFTLLSYAHRLKRKIPQKVETINSVHTVTASTTAQVTVTPALPGTSISGNEYDGKNYYMRVRSTTSTAVPAGFLQTIQGNTSTDRLDFVPSLASVLVAGDVIEVHSGIFATQAVSWNDYDPADAWWEVLTNLLAIPAERIGLGSLPRGGKPPKVTDRAPGDATTQAKLKVTGRLDQEIEGDKVLDILSTIMGGVTLEIDGQIVFVQLVPLLDVNGLVTVPLPPPVAVFDARDFSAPPQTPPGIESRATIVTTKYGVPATAAAPDSFPSKATTAVDPDALLWLQQQNLEDYGTADVPAEISKWLYNTSDQGLYLASVIGAQLVRAASTGLRVFPLMMSEKHPQLVPGDVIIISIDQYTDYDPSTLTQIKGPIAVRGVLVKVGNEGRQLSMFVPGLRDNVKLIAGGAAGALTGLGTGLGLFALSNFRVIAETATTLTYGWTRGFLVNEVWSASVTFVDPVPTDPWALVSAAVSPLPSGIDTITVSKPPEGSVLFLQVEPRSSDLTSGEVRRAVINAAPTQVPSVELDDLETATVGTQWWKITERGIAVTTVEVQTQIGVEPISGWVAPTRMTGAASTVRGGVLGAGEYEHDVTLDPTRIAWIMPRIKLANGLSPIVLGPFGFDRDKNPNILAVSLARNATDTAGAGTVLSILCDSDTKSIRVFDKLGTWEFKLDGVSAVIDVSKTGSNGVAGLGASATSTFTIEARSDPNAYVTGGTLKETRDIVIAGPTAAAPGATWAMSGLPLRAPSLGSAVMQIDLKASAAPASWTVKLYAGLGSPSTDVTGAVSPALSAPPTGLTTYSWNSGYTAIHDPPRTQRTFIVKADLLDNLGVVADSRTAMVSWFSP